MADGSELEKPPSSVAINQPTKIDRDFVSTTIDGLLGSQGIGHGRFRDNTVKEVESALFAPDRSTGVTSGDLQKECLNIITKIEKIRGDLFNFLGLLFRQSGKEVKNRLSDLGALTKIEGEIMSLEILNAKELRARFSEIASSKTSSTATSQIPQSLDLNSF